MQYPMTWKRTAKPINETESIPQLSRQLRSGLSILRAVFGGKITMTITFADSPLADEVPPEWRGKILHMRMMVGDVALMGGDELPEDYIALRGFNVTLNVEQAAGAERIFAALSESGTVTVPLQETFWAVRYGMLTDQFGIPWMINCERAA
jgi:PhnB protein